jgi:hypothetical protein
LRKLLAAAGISALCVAAVAQAGNDVTDAKNSFPKSSETVSCNGDAITFYGSKKLWPPNHKYRTVTITVTENHPTMYSFTTATTSNEGALDPGSGHTPIDATPPMSMSPTMMGPGSQSQDILLRAERDGGGSGRTYSIAVDAKFDGGLNDCQHTFTVTVPHDMRGGASH